ncbi:protein peste-like [Glossina fuscipes fuscipes]
MAEENPSSLLRNLKTFLKYLNILLSISLAGVGTILTIFSSTLFDKYLENELQLKANNSVTRSWIKPDVNISLDVYLFNWTNSHEFLDSRIKPQFQQVGPYGYDEVPYKSILKWHSDDNTLEYHKLHTFYFNETRTRGSLQDRITSINALLVTVASKTKYWPRWVVSLSMGKYQSPVDWKKTVDEFLFKGFHNNIVTLLRKLPSGLLGISVPMDKIGYLYGRNGTSVLSPTYRISTGADGVNSYGQLKFVNGKNHTKHVPSGCSQVRGSSGELQRVNLEKYKPIEYYVADFCRRFWLEYDNEVIVDGVLGYRYKMGNMILDNGTIYSENKCFCNGKCLPAGVVNVTSCSWDMPFFISLPHFLDADDYFINQVEGLQAKRELHEPFIILEPRTGLIMEFRGRFQLNIYLEPSSHLNCFPNKRELLFPILWFDAYMHMSVKTAFILHFIQNFTFYSQLLGMFLITVTMTTLLWKPVKKCCFIHYPQHLEISAMQDDEDDDDENIKKNYTEDLANKEALLGDSSNFIGLFGESKKIYS